MMTERQLKSELRNHAQSHWPFWTGRSKSGLRMHEYDPDVAEHYRQGRLKNAPRNEGYLVTDLGIRWAR